jgi:hypothetical protein
MKHMESRACYSTIGKMHQQPLPPPRGASSLPLPSFASFFLNQKFTRAAVLLALIREQLIIYLEFFLCYSIKKRSLQCEDERTENGLRAQSDAEMREKFTELKMNVGLSCKQSKQQSSFNRAFCVLASIIRIKTKRPSAIK